VRQSRDPTTPAGTSAGGCWGGSWHGRRPATTLSASSALRRVLLGCARHVLTPGGATLSRSDRAVRSHGWGSTGAAMAARSVLPRCVWDPSAPVNANALCSINWPATVWPHRSISSRATTTFGGVLPGVLGDPLAPTHAVSNVASTVRQERSIQLLPKAAMAAMSEVPGCCGDPLAPVRTACIAPVHRRCGTKRQRGRHISRAAATVWSGLPGAARHPLAVVCTFDAGRCRWRRTGRARS